MMMREFIIPFTTGLAIFLFGMQVLKMGFEDLFLQKMKSVLYQLTKTPLTGLLTGIIATAVLQSSSAIILLTIALTHSRMITFRQAIGIILGTNIGTCLTTELIAFQVTDFGLYFFIIGFICFMFPVPAIRSAGLVLGGFGMLFLGMDTMQAITPALKQGGIEALFINNENGIWSGVLVGTILTALIQSSTATTAIVMNLTFDQVFPLTIAIAIILGSNIGTCMTAILGCIGTNTASRQVALAHVMLNVVGVLLFIPLIPLLATLVEWLTPFPMHQVAHAQTIFNVICSLLVLPFVMYVEKIVVFLTPNHK